MNQHLNKILNLIKTNQQLKDSEKSEIESSIKELDRVEQLDKFKLDRAENDKRVISVMLDESIQDLERKTKAIEAQNRELEIESALEKVRTIAMGMRKPADMLDVCKTISLQLQFLGLQEIRNVQTAIFYEQRGIYMNYEFYAKHNKTFVTETTYTNNEIHNEFATKMLKGKGETFITHLKGDEVKDWIAYQKTTNVFIDKYLETAPSLNYYFFSLGPVALGISTYLPLTEDEINLFKRFLKVFELAYQRYLDIEKAEAQAREAQIELALERVRARTMAMQKSDELAETAYILFQQFKELDEAPQMITIGIMNEEKRLIEFWITDGGGEGSNVSGKFNASIDEPILLNKIFIAWKEQRKSIVIELAGKELQDWINYRVALSGVSDNNDYSNSHASIIVGFFSKGILSISTYESRSHETVLLLERFAGVFDLTYTRFQDLKNAEAQAREAQIEASLERVRTRSMAMHKSEELVDASTVLFDELKSLNIETIRTGVGIVDSINETVEVWSSQLIELKQNNILGIVPFNIHPFFERYFESWNSKEPYFFYELNGNELKDYYKTMSSILSYPEKKEFNPRELFYIFFFPEGSLNVVTHNLLSEDECNLMIRFTRVFGLVYRRFLDLKLAEAQAREAQIETSLERVRSRTMAMQQSDELAETAAVVFRQLMNLGIEPNRIYIAIIKDEKGFGEFWITDEDGSKVSSGFTANLNANPTFQKMYEGWKGQKKSITIDMQGKELEEYFKHLSLLNVPFKGGLSQKRRVQSIAYFSKGFIGIASPDEPKIETIQLLERFAAVFNLTYTRFNDLLQAEAQNKIIMAENERKTTELDEARQLQLAMLPKELPQLPNLDIAVCMKTATEVGGDYYDFHVGDGGTLTAVIGDATGHGMKAGTMVTITKSLFNSLASGENILDTYFKISTVIKDMKFRQLSMCLTMLKINQKQLSISSAAMPPALIYKKNKRTIEEISIHGMPLGAMNNFPYSLEKIELEKGDTVLMLTDGLPELKNSKNEMYGYDRIKTEFHLAGEKEPEKIIEHLKNSASNWANGKEPEDDITFVVIKIK